MAAYQAGRELQEVPFRAGCFQHVVGIDLQLVEDQRQLVHQRDVDIALDVLDHFRRLRHPDGGRFINTRRDHALVYMNDHVKRGAVPGRHDLYDIGKRVLPVTRIDAFRGIAQVEIRAAHEARFPLQYRCADLFGSARIDGGFIDDDIVALDDASEHLRCGSQGPHVRVFRIVYRRRYGHDVKIGLLELPAVRGENDLRRRQFVRGNLPGAVLPLFQFRNAPFIDIKPDHLIQAAERDGHGQADVAHADNGDFPVLIHSTL